MIHHQNPLEISPKFLPIISTAENPGIELISFSKIISEIRLKILHKQLQSSQRSSKQFVRNILAIFLETS